MDLAQDSLWAPMETAIRSTLEADGVPGTVLLVARNGDILGHAAFGEADPLAGDPMTTDAQFRICSRSKAITSMAAMVLWEQGLLGLDDPVSTYLPEFADVGVLGTLLADSTGVYSPPSRPVTIRHLMTHTSGIPYGDIGDPRFAKLYAKQGVADLFPIDGRSTRDNASRMARTGLAHDPGEQWTYGLGLDVLVAVIEVASEALCRVSADRIARPAGHGPHPLCPARGPAGPARGVRTRLSRNLEAPPTPGLHHRVSHPGRLAPVLRSGAGLTSTAMDLPRFLQMVLDRGAIPGGRLLEEATIDTILADAPRDWWTGIGTKAWPSGGSERARGQGRFSGVATSNTQGYGDPATGELATP